MDWQKFGQRIRDERTKQRLTQEQLAEKVRINPSFVGQIERGRKKASLETIVKISSVLGTTVDYLLQDIVEVKKNTLLEELVSVAANRDDDEVRLLLTIERIVSDFLDKRK